MSVKEDLTSLLEQSRGEFVSGEEIAQRLGCTRGAVWKAVRSLQDRGFSIEAVKNRGYRLASDCDLLTAEGVKKYLESGVGADVEVFDCVDSTNNVVRRYASEGAQEGKVKTGYAYEYYQKLSEYTGWQYEYVYGEFGDLYQQLLDGEYAGLAGGEDNYLRRTCGMRRRGADHGSEACH